MTEHSVDVPARLLAAARAGNRVRCQITSDPHAYIEVIDNTDRLGRFLAANQDDPVAPAIVWALVTPVDVPARLREATAAVERVRDDMTTHPGAYRQVIDALTLLRRWLAADPEDPAGQAVARALAGPTTDTPGGDR